jgi:hypothetical protein
MTVLDEEGGQLQTTFVVLRDVKDAELNVNIVKPEEELLVPIDKYDRDITIYKSL